MSWTLAGHLAHGGGKCLQIVGRPNLRRYRDMKMLKFRRLWTGTRLYNDKSKGELSQTTILAQSGTNIQELPVIVRKAKLTSALWNEESQSVAQPDTQDEFCSEEGEFYSVIEAIKRCRTVKNLGDFLQSLPKEGTIPRVAVEALRKLIELENNQHYRRRTPQNGNDDDKSRISQRDIIVSQLLDDIMPSKDPKLILSALKIITRDITRAASRQNNYWVGHYRSRLSQEALIYATDSKFSLSELCEVVHAFAYLDADDSNQIDMLWVGFEAKANEINEDNIVEVFKVLPHFKKSRGIVLSVAENAFMRVCWQLRGAAIGEIMSVLQEERVSSQPVLTEVSHWVTININNLSEEELTDIVTAFSGLEHYCPNIVQSLEKYVKLDTQNSALIASIMEFCLRFRVRSPTILESCANHLINNAYNMTPMILKAIFVPYGLLHFYPSNSNSFLIAVDSALEENFARFRPEDAIDVILSCVLLEHYAVEFATKIFSSSFLDRLESSKNLDVVRGAHTKLKLYDMAMTLECGEYDGPLLPRDKNVKTVWVDGRLRRIVSDIAKPLEKLTGGTFKVSPFVLLPEVPAISFYVLDILLHPKQALRAGSNRVLLTDEERDSCLAFLIHVPEHYCSQMHYLNGPQLMRHRHLRKLGIKSIEVRYDMLARLRMNPKSLEKYLGNRLKSVKII